MPDGPGLSGFQDIHIVNDSVPELDIDEIDTGIWFLEKRLKLPVIVNAITGGTEQAAKINQSLAHMALKHGLAMAVGSQKIAVETSSLRQTFSVVRDTNPDGLVFANISAGSSLEQALAAVEMFAADALQLHFNIPQELAMPEGERNFRNVLKRIEQIVEHCPVPVIAKEVGFGLSRESTVKLYNAGITIFDTGGKGGTNFVSIEDRRNGRFKGELDHWGIPTAISLAEVLAPGFPVKVIASGGIRNALDIAKALALGADLTGMAAPFLKVLLKQGTDGLDQWIQDMAYQFKAILLMSGAANIDEMKQKPVVITGETAQWLEARGIDFRLWARKNG